MNTDIDQSKDLLKHGLKPETADMCYLPVNSGDRYHWNISTYSYSYWSKMPDTSPDNCIPSWSTDVLLELMPIIKTKDNKEATPFIAKASIREYYVLYVTSDKEIILSSEIFDTIIEACYDMVVWLLENNYIKQ